MKRFVTFLCVSVFLSGMLFAASPKVIFINPGLNTEAYWVMVSNFMQSAARSFGMDLEILYADRNHMKQISLAEEIARRPVKPDFVICVNEKLVAPQTIAPLDAAGIKTFLILNDLTDEQKVQYGTPRNKYKNWIGTIIPDNVSAGYLMAEKLLVPARQKYATVHMIALSGVRVTPAAAEREDGLKNFLAKNPDIKVEQIFNSDWTEEVGYNQALGALARYPELNAVWCANDLLAIGAIRALKEKGKVPGKDFLVSGLNWSTAGVNAVANGEMVTTVGGHFMCGGWAIVLIQDYLKGKDFAAETVQMKIPGFSSVDSGNVKEYVKNLGSQNWDGIDFTKFAKSAGKTGDYDFGLGAVLLALKK